MSIRSGPPAPPRSRSAASAVAAAGFAKSGPVHHGSQADDRVVFIKEFSDSELQYSPDKRDRVPNKWHVTNEDLLPQYPGDKIALRNVQRPDIEILSISSSKTSNWEDDLKHVGSVVLDGDFTKKYIVLDPPNNEGMYRIVHFQDNNIDFCTSHVGAGRLQPYATITGVNRRY
jgi:hypothetical protein